MPGRPSPLVAVALALATAPDRAQAPPQLESEAIEVRDATEGCFHADQREYAWTPGDDGSYRRGARTLTAVQVTELRRVLLEARTEPPNLLALVGVTPDSVALHRDALLAAALPESWSEREEPLPPELEALLHYDHVAPAALRELRCEDWGSTSSTEFRVRIPGDPVITAESHGVAPYMLPWTITADDETWTVADPRVSEALLPLADPGGPSAPLLDGRAYWLEEFWSDRSFWRRTVGAELDLALSREAYVHLPGYLELAARFQVDDVTTGHINLKPLAMMLELSRRSPGTLGPGAIDEVRWWNLIEDGAPTSDWNDFLALYDAADAAVASQAWLLFWKNAGPNRTFGLDAVGRTGTSETNLAAFVTPAWVDAGFAGEPEFELLLRRDRKWCGTVYLSSVADGALIVTAHAGDGSHWFDALEFAFHPRSKPPTYGRVDGSGVFELRTLEAPPR